MKKEIENLTSMYMDLQAWRIQQDKKVLNLAERVEAMEQGLSQALEKQHEFKATVVETIEKQSKQLLAGVQGQREADRRALNTWLKQKVKHSFYKQL